MTFEFAAPRFLWLLTLVPLIWLAGNAGLRLPVATWSTTSRLLLLLALVAGLAQPMLSRPATRTTMIYLVDGSQSVSARALEAVAQAIDTTNGALRPDSRAFWHSEDACPRVTDTAPCGGSRPDQARNADGRISPERTNLEQALAAARAEIPPSSNGRIVLFSDGRQTEGDALRCGRAAGRVACAGVHAADAGA